MSTRRRWPSRGGQRERLSLLISPRSAPRLAASTHQVRPAWPAASLASDRPSRRSRPRRAVARGCGRLRRIPRKALVRDVGVVLELAPRLDDVDARAALTQRELGEGPPLMDIIRHWQAALRLSSFAATRAKIPHMRDLRPCLPLNLGGNPAPAGRSPLMHSGRCDATATAWLEPSQMPLSAGMGETSKSSSKVPRNTRCLMSGETFWKSPWRVSCVWP